MNFREIFVLIIRFIAISAGMALNMRRVLKSADNKTDDALWIASIIVGIALGAYWRRYGLN